MRNIRAPKQIVTENGTIFTLSDYNKNEKASLTYRINGECHGIALIPSFVETEFTRINRPEPQSNIIIQGKWECAATSLAMLLDEKLFFVKRAMGKLNWRNDNNGASDKVIIETARNLGRDLININSKEITEDLGPCSVTVKSLNVKGICHAVTWNGKEILDPNWGKNGRKWWGCEWAPWTMSARSALVLLDRNLSISERKELDEMVRANKDVELQTFKAEVFKSAKK